MSDSREIRKLAVELFDFLVENDPESWEYKFAHGTDGDMPIPISLPGGYGFGRGRTSDDAGPSATEQAAQEAK